MRRATREAVNGLSILLLALLAGAAVGLAMCCSHDEEPTDFERFQRQERMEPG